MWIQLLTLELIDGASEVVAAVQQVGAGLGGHLFKDRRGRRNRVIRYSDFETREAYEAALRAAIPMSEVKPYDTIERTLADEEDEEEAIITMLMQVIH